MLGFFFSLNSFVYAFQMSELPRTSPTIQRAQSPLCYGLARQFRNAHETSGFFSRVIKKLYWRTPHLHLYIC